MRISGGYSGRKKGPASPSEDAGPWCVTGRYALRRRRTKRPTGSRPAARRPNEPGFRDGGRRRRGEAGDAGEAAAEAGAVQSGIDHSGRAGARVHRVEVIVGGGVESAAGEGRARRWSCRRGGCCRQVAHGHGVVATCRRVDRVQLPSPLPRPYRFSFEAEGQAAQGVAHRADLPGRAAREAELVEGAAGSRGRSGSAR